MRFWCIRSLLRLFQHPWNRHCCGSIQVISKARKFDAAYLFPPPHDRCSVYTSIGRAAGGIFSRIPLQYQITIEGLSESQSFTKTGVCSLFDLSPSAQSALYVCPAAAVVSYLHDTGDHGLLYLPVPDGPSRHHARLRRHRPYSLQSGNWLGRTVHRIRRTPATTRHGPAGGRRPQPHVHFTHSSNLWWWDVLENGPSSDYSRHFDIDWNPPKSELANKVLLPFCPTSLAWFSKVNPFASCLTVADLCWIL